MTTAFTLDQLTAAAGDDEFVPAAKSVYRFKMGVAYPVEVTDVTVKANDRGQYRAMLKLGVVNPDGTTGDGDAAFISLPVVTDELAASGDPEDVQKYKNAAGTSFLNVLRVLMPEAFSIYASSGKLGGKTMYTTTSGELLTYKQVEIAKKALVKPAIGVAKKLIAGEKLFVGARAYFVWNANKKKPEFPYANFYSEAPVNYPAAE